MPQAMLVTLGKGIIEIGRTQKLVCTLELLV